MHDVRLEVNTEAFGGFQGGSFTMSLESLAATFELRYADTWTERGESVPIDEGDRCKVLIDGLTLIDGWVVESTREYDATSRKLSVSGASLTTDLVDCTAMNEPGRWRNQLVSQIVADLCYPFATIQPMVVGDEGARIPKFAIDDGETVGSAISRLARLRGLQCYSAGSELVLTKAGNVRTSTVLRYGRPILRARRVGSLAQRFSDYVFKGQTRATDERNGIAASQINGTIFDNGVPRYRPILLDAHAVDGPDDIGARAIMERNQRAGQAERISVTVEGWTTDEGWLWEPNMRVRIADEWLDVDQEMIVVSVKLTYNGDTGAGGYATEMELCDPAAFDTGDAPLVRRRRARRQDNPNPLVYFAGGSGGLTGQQAFGSFATGSGFGTSPNLAAQALLAGAAAEGRADRAADQARQAAQRADVNGTQTNRPRPSRSRPRAPR